MISKLLLLVLPGKAARLVSCSVLPWKAPSVPLAPLSFPQISTKVPPLVFELPLSLQFEFPRAAKHLAALQTASLV